MSFTTQDFARIESLVIKIKRIAKDMGIEPEFLLKVISVRVKEVTDGLEE